MQKDNIIRTKSISFSLQIIRLYKLLIKSKEFIPPNRFSEVLQVSEQT